MAALGRPEGPGAVVPHRGRERGHEDLGWLEAYYTFSFASHYDPARRGFRSLRALNERWLAPRAGFGEHPHANVEILTLVLEGVLAQRDGTGTTLLGAGEVQRLTTGRGMCHDEFNPSWQERAHYLELWIEPDHADLPPGREQRPLPEDTGGALQVVGGRADGNGILAIHQDVEALFGRVAPGARARRALARGRHGWLQILAGAVEVNGQLLEAGDGAAIGAGAQLALLAVSPAAVLLLDLP
jgi:redox-sensitive bicupin YhaK (pirin superfamily)